MADRFTRRDFLKTAGTAGALLAASPWLDRLNAAEGAVKPGQAVLPNIILILADDLGIHDLGCYGNAKIKTPKLDGFADEGVRCETFYSCAAVCSPSRRSLLTGRYPIGPIPRDKKSIAEVLKAKGYATACIGKWDGLGNPNKQGFDYVFGVPLVRSLGPLGTVYRNGVAFEDLKSHEQLTSSFTQEAVQFIEQNRTKPFFLYLAETAPHKPLAPSEGFKGKSAAGVYGDVVEELDWSVGEVLASVRKHGLERNTIVILTSDNGPEHGCGSSGALRGNKYSVYEGGVRMPLLVRWPGIIPTKSRCTATFNMIDLYATCITAAGGQLPQQIDGKDVMALLAGNGKTPHETLFFISGSRIGAVRSGKWKLVVIPKNHSVAPELYDLEADPEEKKNLAADQPDRVKNMTALISECAKNHGVNPAARKIEPAQRDEPE